MYTACSPETRGGGLGPLKEVIHSLAYLASCMPQGNTIQALAPHNVKPVVTAWHSATVSIRELSELRFCSTRAKRDSTAVLKLTLHYTV